MKTLRLFAAAVLVTGVFSGSAFAADTVEEVAGNVSKLVGKSAPEISLPGVAGTPRTLADFAGKYVILEWVDFTCPYVRKHYDSKNMQALQTYFKSHGAIWLSVNSAAPTAAGYLAGKDLRIRLAKEKSDAADFLIDSNGIAQKAYGVTAIPTVVLIDPEGIVRYVGAIDDQPTLELLDPAKTINFLANAYTAVSSSHDTVPDSRPAYGCQTLPSGQGSR